MHRQIRDGYPSPEVTRRNTGYALDELIACDALGGGSGPLQMGKLLSGSEGTLALTTSVTLRLDPLPPTKNVMVVAHFTTIDECVGSASVAMRHPLHACEMIDKTILDLTANNSAQAENRQLIVGDPAGVLMCELGRPTRTPCCRNWRPIWSARSMTKPFLCHRGFAGRRG